MGTKKQVKDIEKYHAMDSEILAKLSTRELIAVLGSSRGQNICSCGKGRHCGDDVLSEGEIAWNKAQDALYARTKLILNSRENLVSRKPEPKKERKDHRMI